MNSARAREPTTDARSNHRKPMNKLIHGLILAWFGFGCWCLWGVLKLTGHLLPAGADLPAFSQLCVNLRSVLFVLPALAAVYCGYAWFRRNAAPNGWIAFLAVTTGVLVLLLTLTFIAAWLPLVKVIELKG
jgi:hypothetical protein